VNSLPGGFSAGGSIPLTSTYSIGQPYSVAPLSGFGSTSRAYYPGVPAALGPSGVFNQTASIAPSSVSTDAHYTNIEIGPFTYTYDSTVVYGSAAELAAPSRAPAAREGMLDFSGPRQVAGAASQSVGAPGLGESLIPIWGSGRAAINDFQEGRWGWGLVNTALAVSDVFLVKSLVTAGGKLVVKGGAKLLGREAAEQASTVVAREVGEQVVERSASAAGLLSESVTGNAIDPARLSRIKAAFQRTGRVIDQSADAERYLQMHKAGGVTFDARTVLLPQRPTTTAVFEEMIHTAQHRTGRFAEAIGQFGNAQAEVRMEIEAAEKLINYRKAYQIPASETRQTIQRLRGLREQLR
jgi:hypothetical protein